MGQRTPAPADRPGTVDLPPPLEDLLFNQLGQKRDAFVAALNAPSPVSIRLNPAKAFAAELEPVPWCSTGRYLGERPAFTFDPLLHAGAYYVQEASSMLLEVALRRSGLLEHDVLALDLCAAPGGKSTHLRSLLAPGSLLIANEVDGHRRSILQENLWKWGQSSVAVAGTASQRLQQLPDRFDLILLDAPCSGEGMFRKDAHARAQWSPGLVQQCASVQHTLVRDAWTALTPGGVLVYSTCTWEPAENEAQIAQLIALGAEVLPLEAPAGSGVLGTGAPVHGLRCYPHRVRGEGFFVACVRKPGERRPHSSGVEVKPLEAPISAWLQEGRPQVLSLLGEVQYAVDARWSATLRELGQVLHLSAPGIPVAYLKGGSWRPHAALALNVLLRPDAFERIDVEEEAAIRYLRGEALPAAGAHGTALLTHRGIGLGWLQGAGRRWNNQWPTAWRIRSAAPSASRVSWTTIHAPSAP